MYKKFNILGVKCHSFLNEVKRNNLIGKTKSQSKQRYDKRINYSSLGCKSVDLDELLLKDKLVVELYVVDYICTLQFNNVIKSLKDILDSQPQPNLTLQSVVRAINKTFENPDMLIDCSCADFKYRFAFWATKFGYKYGKPETRRSDKTNPNNNQGSMCKHLTSLLTNKKWIPKVAQQVNKYFKEYPEFVCDILDLPEDYIIINDMKIPKGSKWNPITKKYEIPNENNEETEEEAEEIE